MKINAKNAVKVAGAACAATGIVTLSALVASGAAVGAVAVAFHTVRVIGRNRFIDVK